MHCFISGCPNGCDGPKDQKKARMVQIFFTAPEDETLFRQWQIIIPRSCNKVFTRGDKLCDLHFKKSEVVLFNETKLPNGNVRRIPALEPKLKAGTIPSIFPKGCRTDSDADKNKESKTVTISEVQKARGKRKHSTDDLESQDTPSRPRGRPRKLISEGNQEKTTTPVPEKRKKIENDVEPGKTVEEILYKEIESDDETNEELALAMQPTIRVVPLESLMAPAQAKKKDKKDQQQEPAKGSTGNKKRKQPSQAQSPPAAASKKKKVHDAKPPLPALKPIESRKKVRENIQEVCAELEMAVTDTSDDEGAYEIEHTTDVIDDEGADLFEIGSIKNGADDVDQKKTLEELAAELGGSDPDLLSISGSSSDNTQKPRITEVISLCGMDDEGNLIRHNEKVDNVELEMAKILGEDVEPSSDSNQPTSSQAKDVDKGNNEDQEQTSVNTEEISKENSATSELPKGDSTDDQATSSTNLNEESIGSEAGQPEKKTSDQADNAVKISETDEMEKETEVDPNADAEKTEVNKAKTGTELDIDDTEAGTDKTEADKAETEADKAETEADKAETEPEKDKAEKELDTPETEIETDQTKTGAESDKVEAETEASKAEAEADVLNTENDKLESETEFAKDETELNSNQTGTEAAVSNEILSKPSPSKENTSEQHSAAEEEFDETEVLGQDNEPTSIPGEDDSHLSDDELSKEDKSESPLKVGASDKHGTEKDENEDINRKESQENDVEEVDIPSSGSSVVLDISSDSEADPTWAPGPDTIVVSDENDTDPGSNAEDDSPTSDEKKKIGPKSSKSPTKIQSKGKKTESRPPPSVAQVAKILHPDALKQILSNLTFPLNGPVALSIADGSSLNGAPRQIISNKGVILNENCPARFRASRRAQISGERGKKCAKLLGLKMFEGLGKIKKAFDFSTFISDPDDELQFKKFCLILRECLRDVCESKNAVTNIGKLTVTISHKTLRSDMSAFSQALRDAEMAAQCEAQQDNSELLVESLPLLERAAHHLSAPASKEVQPDNADEAEMFECMTVDSNVENHYESGPSIENAMEEQMAT